MITRFTSLILLLCTLATNGYVYAQSTEQLLLSGWRFAKGAQNDAQAQNFNDSHWQQVSIPHDWAIAGPFDKEIDKQVVAIVQNGETEATEKTGRSGSLPWIGEGWYRTTITIPEGYSHAELIFDGAMAEPHVYLDGKDVGYWAYGYNSFILDITESLPRDRSNEGHLIPGTHTLAVHLQNVEESSRWYPGAGLYRPVRLRLSQATGLKTWGIFARTTKLENIDDTGSRATMALITINTQVRNHSAIKRNYKVVHTLLNASGEKVTNSEAWLSDSYETCQILRIPNASLWSPEHPCLYTLITELLDGDAIIDHQETKTGIRLAEYSNAGFKLNGQLRKFKGVCLHHDLGPLGAAFNKAAFRRQVRLLKEIGCDAIRTSHNMPAPWQMDICDEMGMMVMAESCDMWIFAKCKNGYARFFEQIDTTSPNADGRQWWMRDFENLVLAHRNHPSIMMWSIGNEIPDQSNANGLKYTRLIQNLIHNLDPTRPCTQGNDNINGAIWSGVLSESEIPGFNYRVQQYEKGLAASPRGLILGSETASTVSSRGVYHFPVIERHGVAEDAMPDGQISSYDLQACLWSNLPDDDWMWQDKVPWLIGEFVWTGFDYLGEPTPYDEYWPSRSSYFGIYDLAGLPKDRVWLYRTHWAPEKETLHILPHWNWEGREGMVTPVFCYTSYPEAELFINGKSYGRRKHSDVSLDEYKQLMTDFKTPWGEVVKYPLADVTDGKNRLDRYRMRWMDVKYEPGEVKIVAYDAHGNIANEKVLRTAGKPHHIELSSDRNTLSALPLDAEGKALDTPDLSFVTVKVVDKDGNLCPTASNQMTFSVKGTSARFNSCCNGDATSLETFKKPTMKVFNGQLIVVVEATSTPGTATLTVTSPGLKKCLLPIFVK